MNNRAFTGPLGVVGPVLSAVLLLALGIPVLALVVSTSPADLSAGIASPLFLPALSLSLRTSALSVVLIVLTGTPLAWWIAHSTHRAARALEVLVDVPVVVPPAVMGVALLFAFGHEGLFGPLLAAVGLRLPFSEAAVVLAQTVVAAPFYVGAAANAFAKVDDDLLIVARSLGATDSGAFVRVAIPVALPGLIAGVSLAWARALGEFGATLVFAGNLSGTTQTMPLAILSALEVDVNIAAVLALVLAGLGAVLLFGLRLVPWAVARSSRSSS